MENIQLTPVEGGICAPQGFSAAGVHCGIRHNHTKPDLAIIKADVRCTGAACYTTNKVYGAPITVDREHLADGYAQAIVVNSGNANTCAPNGVQLAKDVCALTAQALGVAEADVLPASRTYSSFSSRVSVRSLAAWSRRTAAAAEGTSPRKVPSAVVRWKDRTRLSAASTVME